MELFNPRGNAVSSGLQILLVGPRRTGKSSTGNTLLGRGQVFDTRGGGASTVATAVTAGRHLTVVDAQGWGSSEELVPKEEKIELLRALSLCGLEGPHVILLVIPLLDFTEPERRAVERRMEVLPSAIWRHTMVLFTFGDHLKVRQCSIQEHIQSGGPALHWLMEKCRYRYHVLDNKTAIPGKQGGPKQEVNEGGRKQGWSWRKKNEKRVGSASRGDEADGRREGVQEQVRELLGKVEDMLQENGGWHFSLHMYQRLEEEWCRRELQLRAGLEAETDVGKREQKTAETKVKVEPGQEERFEQEKQGPSLRKELQNKQECVEGEINRGEDKEEVIIVALKRQSSEEDSWDTSSDSGEEKEAERSVILEGKKKKEGTEIKIGMMAPCRPNGSQRSAFSPIWRFA
ncbi:GTPase IMAP family member 4 [Amphiprion ocellaris]|uniref:AIG1-type G domain-containing protein n=1 Tax=Amphiprion ocellaris TaxID=80972 RepID=A0A3Q1DED5_AMPOC|nr:GTPase IMAP family member 4 [Amphiprion ocellaris]